MRQKIGEQVAGILGIFKSVRNIVLLIMVISMVYFIASGQLDTEVFKIALGVVIGFFFGTKVKDGDPEDITKTPNI